MKKNKILLSSILAALIIILIIGGIIYMIQKKEQDLISAEKQSVLVLKNTFADIKEIQIKKTGYHEMSGSYTMYAKIINTEKKEATFSYSFWQKRNEIGSYGITNREVQKKGITKNKIKVIYSDGTEDEL